MSQIRITKAASVATICLLLCACQTPSSSAPDQGANYSMPTTKAATGANKVTQLSKAAKQGDATAQFKLGTLYQQGKGVPQDYGKAIYWYRKAAEQGHEVAQMKVGLMYANGLGVEKDYAKSVYWYRKSAKQGYAVAQGLLGLMCYFGRGMAKDEEKAIFWLEKAAAQGNEVARKLLERLNDP